MEVGDAVKFIPGKEFALQRNQTGGPHGPAGSYPWVLGRVKGADVLELTDKDAEKFLDFIRRAPDVKMALRQLALVRPKHSWPATVTAVHEDGTVDVDVQSNMGGVTMHLTNVPIGDVADPEPHTCVEVE